MSNKTQKKEKRGFGHFSILVFVLALLLSALLTGYIIYKATTHKPSLSNNLENTGLTLQSGEYAISKPSQGAFVQTQEITLDFKENSKAVAILPVPQDNVRQYQEIILYDEDLNILPLGGKIENLTQEGDKITLSIALPEGTKTEFLSQQADIMTLNASASFRLPLTALGQDKNDNYYVWKAEPAEPKGTYNAIKTWVTAPMISEDNFVAGYDVGMDDLIILNPDKKIKHKEAYKMKVVEYSAPFHDPITQAFYDYQRLLREKDTKDARQRLIDCRKNAQERAKNPALGATSGTCGGQSPLLNGKKDPMKIFNAILSRQPQNLNGTSGSCNTGECAPR